MNRKFLTQLLVVALVAGVVGSAVSASPVKADLLKDFLEKFVPNFELKMGLPKAPAENSPVGKAEGLMEKPAPIYESRDVHEEAVISAVETAAPSVVSIVISKNLPVYDQCAHDLFSDLPMEFREFFGGDSGFVRPCQKGTKKQEVGGGSGFIISADGLVLTNKHVVNDAKAEYTVLTNDGKKYPAKIMARDPVQDLAVVKIAATGLKPLKLGNSDSIRLGQTAIAIGNALAEFRNTVSVGVISGLARSIIASDGVGSREVLDGLIQTDAAINPGNSGGPLLNLKGEVIGVNTAIASDAQSIGFAIPINKAKRDIESVKSSGKISVPYLGVRYLLVDEELAAKEKLPVQYGALLRGNQNGPAVVNGSPAYKAGLQAEDVILEIEGVKVDEKNPLSELVQKYKVGEVLHLKVLRAGKEKDFYPVLEERKE